MLRYRNLNLPFAAKSVELKGVEKRYWYKLLLSDVVNTHKAYNPQYIMLNMCLCLLQVGVRSKMAEWITELVFGTGDSFHLCTLQFRISSIILVLPSGTLSQTPDLENFASVSQSLKHVINLARQSGRSHRNKLHCRRLPPSFTCGTSVIKYSYKLYATRPNN